MAKDDIQLNDKAQGPLDDRAAIETQSVRLAPRSLCGKLIIRGAGKTIGKAVKGVLKSDLPERAGLKRITSNLVIYWLGPDECMVLCPLHEAPALKTDLIKALEGLHSAVVDVSDYYCELELNGNGAVDLLAKGSPINLEISHFAVGNVWQTRFAKANIIIDRESETSFRLMVRWSMAAYLWDRLAQSIYPNNE